MEFMILSRKRIAVTTATILAVFAGVWLCGDKAPRSASPAKNLALITSSEPNILSEKSTRATEVAPRNANPVTAKLPEAEVSPGTLPAQSIIDLKRTNFEAYLRYQARLSQGAVPQTDLDSSARKIAAEERVKARLAAALDLRGQS